MRRRKAVILHDAGAVAGGVATVLAELDGLAELGFEVTLYTWSLSPRRFREEAEKRGANVKTYPGEPLRRAWRLLGLPLAGSRSLRAAESLVRGVLRDLAAEAAGADLVHVHHSRLEPLLPGVARRDRRWVKTLHSAFYVCPLQATPGTWLGRGCRGYWLDGGPRCLADAARLGPAAVPRALRGMARLRLVARAVAETYGSINAPSRFLASMAEPGLGRSVSVVRNPLPREAWLHLERAAGAEKGGYVLFLGRLAREKGVEDLEAVATVLRREGLRLVVAGDGPLRPLVERLHARGLVEYRGYVWGAEKYRLLASASALVFPSRAAENMPMAIAEAFAAGVPAAAYRLGGQRELVEETGCGLLVEPYDAEALGEAAARLAAENRGWEKCRQWALGLRPRRYVERLLLLTSS